MGQEERIKLIEIMPKLLSSPFKIGGRTIEDGFDCLTLPPFIFNFLGKEMAWKFDNVYLYRCPTKLKSSKQGRELLFKYYSNYGVEVKLEEKKFLDVLIGIPKKSATPWVGLYIENDSILAPFETGIATLSVKVALKITKEIKVFRIWQ